MGGYISKVQLVTAPSMDKDTLRHGQASAWNRVLCPPGNPPQQFPVTYLLPQLQGTGKHWRGFVGCFVLFEDEWMKGDAS